MRWPPSSEWKSPRGSGLEESLSTIRQGIGQRRCLQKLRLKVCECPVKDGEIVTQVLADPVVVPSSSATAVDRFLSRDGSGPHSLWHSLSHAPFMPLKASLPAASSERSSWSESALALRCLLSQRSFGPLVACALGWPPVELPVGPSVGWRHGQDPILERL